jgi:hypothetical protein
LKAELNLKKNNDIWNFFNKILKILSSDGSESPVGLPPANPYLFFSAAMGPTKKDILGAEQRRLRRVRTWRRAIMKVSDVCVFQHLATLLLFNPH